MRQISFFDGNIGKHICKTHYAEKPSAGEDIKITKVWAMPNGNTFTIKPIKAFVET